jgi:hypothetical protein
MASHELPPQAHVMNFITGMWAAQTVATVAQLAIPDHLASGPKTAAELAPVVKAHPEALHRLMRGAASVGVFAKDAQNRFSLTPIGECLRSGVPGSMRAAMIAEMAPGHWLPWGHLEESVRTGKPAAPTVLGMDAWGYYKKNPEEGKLFAEAMTGMSAMANHAVMGTYSFKGAKKVIDVGGSHGAFLAAVLSAEPSAHGVLFDRPEVIEGAGPTLGAVANRVERVGGSFFDQVPAGGDVYLLKHILHDWNDAECVTILKNVRDAMAPDGRVVVVEMLITDQGPPSPAPLLDLNMLVMLTGKERTADEFGALFAEAGLKLAKVVPTMSPFAVVEAHRV